MMDAAEIETSAPTIQQIIDATGGEESRDGESVIIGYGSDGYLRLIPDYIIRGGAEMPAVAIEGRLMRRNGGRHSDVRDMIRAAGMEIS